MRSFLQRGHISLRSQHAYYCAPSSGFIKTRWNTWAFYTSTESLVKTWVESIFFLNDKFEVWSFFGGVQGFFFFSRLSCMIQQTRVDTDVAATVHAMLFINVLSVCSVYSERFGLIWSELVVLSAFINPFLSTFNTLYSYWSYSLQVPFKCIWGSIFLDSNVRPTKLVKADVSEYWMTETSSFVQTVTVLCRWILLTNADALMFPLPNTDTSGLVKCVDNY